MKMSFHGYTYIFASILHNKHYSIKTLNIYAVVKISRVERKHQMFFSIDFHVDIDMKTVDAFLYHFFHISIV